MLRHIPLFVLLVACTPRRVGDGTRTADYRVRAEGTVVFRITITEPYCGGADIGISHYPERPLGDRVFHVRRGTTNDPDVRAIAFRTDSAGSAVPVLRPGTYALIDNDRVDDRRYKQLLRDHARPGLYTSAIDPDCLRNWFRTPLRVFDVRTATTDTVVLQLHGSCPWTSIPCVAYSGPLPP